MYAARVRQQATAIVELDRTSRRAWDDSTEWLSGSTRNGIERACVAPLDKAHSDAARLLDTLADAAAAAERELWG